MKLLRNIFLTVFISGTAISLQAQNWFPIGATWHYSYSDGFTVGEITIQVVKDTIVAGVFCKLLSQLYMVHGFTTLDTTYEPNLYAFEQNDSVYFLQEDTFVLVYNLNMPVNNIFEVPLYYIDPVLFPDNNCSTIYLYVDSIKQITMNGQTLKCYVFGYADPNSNQLVTRIERIGPINEFLIPSEEICGGSSFLTPPSASLICYTDSVIGTYLVSPYTRCDIFSTTPTFIAQLPGNETVCPGTVDTLKVGVANGTGPYTYQWSSTGTTVLSSDTGATPYLTINGDGSVRATVTDGGGSTSIAAQNFTAGIAGTINITPSGPTIFCTGDSVTLSAGAGYTSYLWSDSSTSSSITVSQSGNYTVTATIGTNCTGTGSVAVSIVTPPVAQTIVGNPSISPYQNYSYAVTQVSGVSYDWTIQGGAIISGQATNVIMVVWNGSGPYVLTVVQTKSGNCSATSTLTVLSTGIQSVDADGIIFYAYYVNGQNVIKTNNPSSENYSLHLSDMSGRTVFEKSRGNVEQIILPNYISKGVYIAQALFANGLVKKLKVVIR